MPDTEAIVINTGPLLALAAALDNFAVLPLLYKRILVPHEVCEEMLAGGAARFGARAFADAPDLVRWATPVEVSPFLRHCVDRGEAAVIQLALNEGVRTVCIDEVVGRRVARLNGLSVTGSIGVLLRARRQGYEVSLRAAIDRMRARGIWLGDDVVRFALREAGEGDPV